MSGNFVKVYGSILDSSIWCQDIATKIVWITMLCMADEDGMVEAAVPGLAHRAGVGLQECQRALEHFLGPDPFSRDGTSGERIEQVPGGWLILNHRRYRERRSQEAVRKANWRARKAAESADVSPGKPPNGQCQDSAGQTGQCPNVPAEAEAEAEAESRQASENVSGSGCRRPKEKPTVPEKSAAPRRAPFEPLDLLSQEYPDGWESPAVRDALAAWVRFRREAKYAPWVPTTWRKQFNKARKLGWDVWVAAVAVSIENQWRGVFPKREGHVAVPGKDKHDWIRTWIEKREQSQSSLPS